MICQLERGRKLEMYDFVSVITRSKFWRDLTEDEKILLINNGNKKVIYRKGDIVDNYGAIVVLSGVLRAFVLTEEGKYITIGYLMPGDFDAFNSDKLSKLAELGIQFEVIEKSEVYKIPVSTILILKGNPKFENFLLEVLENHYISTINAMKQLIGKSLEVRIASCLDFRAELRQSPILKITHEDIAKCINSSREVVTKALKLMAHEGVIELQRGTIIIQDVDKLKEISSNRKS